MWLCGARWSSPIHKPLTSAHPTARGGDAEGPACPSAPNIGDYGAEARCHTQMKHAQDTRRFFSSEHIAECSTCHQATPRLVAALVISKLIIHVE